MIDIGVNLTNKRLRFDVEEILEQSSLVNVNQLIITGTSIEHSQLAIELCDEYPKQLFSTAGVHPHDAKQWNKDSKSAIVTLLENECVKAIGEAGLDFNRDFSPRDCQVDAFQQQLEIASQHQKPVFLHQRDAMDTFQSILKEYRHQLQNVVVHCFTDNKKALFSLLDLDCHIGITGWVCDERRGTELQSLVKNIPNNRLMIETDSPYLLPRDLPEKPPNNTNLPKFLPHILKTIALHQNKQLEILDAEVLATTRHFFNI